MNTPHLSEQEQLRREKLEKARTLFAAVGMASHLAHVEALLREP